MVEKKLGFWFEKDGKRKRTPKVSPKVVALKIVIKGKVGKGESHERLPTKKKSPQRLVDEPVLNPTDLIQQGVELRKMTLDDFVKQSEDAKAAKEAESSTKNVEADSLKEKEVKGVVESDSSATESDVDPTMIAHISYISGKQKFKGVPKEKKNSDEEDSTYEPSPQEKKKKVI
ncbi:hypothetical protein Hanom_Chr02g00125321 [Helianthus anomalus]